MNESLLWLNSFRDHICKEKPYGTYFDRKKSPNIVLLAKTHEISTKEETKYKGKKKKTEFLWDVISNLALIKILELWSWKEIHVQVRLLFCYSPLSFFLSPTMWCLGRYIPLYLEYLYLVWHTQRIEFEVRRITWRRVTDWLNTNPFFSRFLDIWYRKKGCSISRWYKRQRQYPRSDSPGQHMCQSQMPAPLLPRPAKWSRRPTHEGSFWLETDWLYLARVMARACG